MHFVLQGVRQDVGVKEHLGDGIEEARVAKILQTGAHLIAGIIFCHCCLLIITLQLEEIIC